MICLFARFKTMQENNLIMFNQSIGWYKYPWFNLHYNFTIDVRNCQICENIPQININCVTG